VDAAACPKGHASLLAAARACLPAPNQVGLLAAHDFGAKEINRDKTRNKQMGNKGTRNSQQFNSKQNPGGQKEERAFFPIKSISSILKSPSQSLILDEEKGRRRRRGTTTGKNRGAPNHRDQEPIPTSYPPISH
jgi:hypothetical protein